MDNVNKMRELSGKVGHSTNGYKALQYLSANDIEIDTVMMFSDLQLWNDNGWGDSAASLRHSN